MNIIVVPVADIDKAWPHVAERFVKAVEKAPTYLTVGDMWALCRSGAGFLLVAVNDDGIRGASVWQFDSDKFICRIIGGVGMDEWAAGMMAKAAEMARLNGSSAICGEARVGMVEIFRKHVPAIKVVRQTYLMEV